MVGVIPPAGFSRHRHILRWPTPKYEVDKIPPKIILYSHRREGKPTKPERKDIMKTAEIVKTAKGFYVTLRYYGQNKGREFFAIKTSVDAAEKRAKKFAKAWTGE
jgi:hypothetical protein